MTDGGDVVLAELDGGGVVHRPVGEAVEERFEIGGVLGRGGQATVYRARDRLLGRQVALKVFDPDSDLATTERVQHEMRTLASLEHPGIVTIFDIGTSDGRPFLVMRLVDRGSLHDLLRDGPLPPTQAAVLAAALGDALGHVHARGLVHRDLKPANVLLAADPAGSGFVPLLADFGTASPTPGVDADPTVGTPAYLAPEQAEGGPVGPETDVYALGLVVLEALTGQREFRGAAHEAVEARLRRDPVIPPGLPADLGALLVAMTARDPRRRPTPVRVAAEARRVARLDDDAPTRRHPTSGALVLPGGPEASEASRPPEVAAGRPASRRGTWSRRALLAGATALGVAGALVAAKGDPPPASPPSVHPVAPVAVPPAGPPPGPPAPPSPAPPAPSLAPTAPSPAPASPAPVHDDVDGVGPDDAAGPGDSVGAPGSSGRPHPRRHGGRHRR